MYTIREVSSAMDGCDAWGHLFPYEKVKKERKKLSRVNIIN